MQDNIPNALIAAFERHYDCSWDTPALRNERLAMRYGWAAAEAGRRLEPPTDSEIETVFARLPGGAQGFLKEWGYLQFAREILEMAPAMQSQCLHQIQEPAAAEQAAWHAGLDEGRAQAALPKSDYLEGVNIPNLREALIFLGRENGVGEGEVGDKLAQYVNSVVSGVLSKKATLREAPQAAPAAVAVPDGGTPGPWRVRKREKDGEVLGCFVTAPDCQGRAYDADILGDDYDTMERKLADCELIVAAVNAYRAALAATPANCDSLEQLNGNNDLPAAAPVVLPEPAPTPCRSMFTTQREYADAMEQHRKNWAEVEAERALLATATGLPAQAVADEVHCVCGASWLRHGVNNYEMTDTPRKAQADARDAELRHVERRISMIPMRMDKPSEVRVTWSLGEKEPKIQISGWHIDGHGTSLPGNPDAAIHASCNLLLDELERLKAVRETGTEVIYPNSLPMHAYCAAIAAAKGE